MNTLMDRLVDQEEALEFVKNAITLIKEKYIFSDVAEEIGTLLQENVNKGKYNTSYTYREFKKIIEEDMQSINGDKHLHIHIQEIETNEVDEKEMRQEYIRMAEKNNYGFHKMERLPGNVGYVDIRAFYDSDIASETAVHVMNSIIHTDALIVDLRNNVGGSLNMVAVIASYFFDELTHIDGFYDRIEDKTSQVWTLPYVPGKLYLDKPVYVLTSKKTFSAGELFAYALKHQGRITVVGESTGGGANPGIYHQLTKQLRLFVSSGRSINPITGTNWEGTGVEPDIVMEAEESLPFTYEMALSAVKEKYLSKQGYDFLLEEIEDAIKNQSK
ncbi:S41 family peptidase [Bacillus sp. BGMRC 2118]|nr:S41 family peptidase [Bacillus sp. BGMRC 2118]